MSKKKSEKAPIMTGYLSKQGGFIRNWKKRYFVLTSDTLEYYEDQHAYDSQQAPKGSVSIIGSNVQSFATSDHGKPYAFGVTPPLPSSPTPTKHKSRQYILVADDEPARIDWLIALTAISEGRIPSAPSTSTTTTSTSESTPDSGRTSPTSYLHSHSLREGYLLKQGGVVKNWKRRYFVLSQRARQLAYYKEKDETTLTKIIDLTGARIAREPESERMNVFSITPQTNGGNDKIISNISSLFSEKTNVRKFLIQASSSVEMNAWLEDLQRVVAAEPVKRKSTKTTATSSTTSSAPAATSTSIASASTSASTSTPTPATPSTSTNGTPKTTASPTSSPISEPEHVKKHKISNTSASKPPLPKHSSATEGEDRPLSSGDLSGHVWRFYGTDVDDPDQSNKWKQRWCILLRESQSLKYWRHSSDVQSAPGSSLDLLRASIVAEPHIICPKSSHVLSITTRGARGQIKHKTYFAFSTPERLEKWLTALQQAAVPDTDEYKDKVISNPSPIEAKLLSALQHNVERFMEFRARSVEYFKGHLTSKEYLIVYVHMFGEEQAVAMFDDVLSVLPDPDKRTELSRLFATRSSWLSSESAAAAAAAEAAKSASSSMPAPIESESDSDEETTEERVQARLASMEIDENKQKQEAKEKEMIQNTLSSHITSWSHNAITGKPHSLLILLSTLDDVWTSAQKGEFVPDSSDFVELKRTYLRVLHIIHPDKHTHADMETRVRAERIFHCLSTAFEKEVKKQPNTSGKTSVG